MKEETKEKIRQSVLKRYREDNELKKKISIKTKEAMARPEVKEKLKNRIMTDELRKKISIKTKEAMAKPEIRKKIIEKNREIIKMRKERGDNFSTINEESKIKISNSRKGKCLENNNHNWKGGNYRTWHRKAYELFGKKSCEKCKKTNEENINEVGKRLSMHNTLNPKDYTMMKKEAWQCLCNKCHAEID